MNNEVFPSFRTIYIDYQGRLRHLDVESSVDPDGQLYFLCIIDKRKAYAIRVEEDCRWHDRYDGPTPLADELGSVIESKLEGDNE
jgi:hypothetical protein